MGIRVDMKPLLTDYRAATSLVEWFTRYVILRLILCTGGFRHLLPPFYLLLLQHRRRRLGAPPFLRPAGRKA